MSKYDTTSTFPYEVDPLIFFSDIRLEQEVTLGTYKELVDNKQYDEATTYLETHKDIDAYCADLFNMLVNRVRALQAYCNGDFSFNNNNELNISNDDIEEVSNGN